MRPSMSASSRPQSVGGRIAGTLFGLVFAGFGCVFIGLVAFGFLRDGAKQNWPEAELRIEAASVEPGERSGFDATFRYEGSFEGRRLRGTRTENEESYRDAAALVARHPAGSTLLGRVNPSDADEVDLGLDGPGTMQWIVLPFLLIPLVFVVIGGGIAWKSLRPAKPVGALSSGKPGVASRRVAFGAGVLFGGLFLMIGGVATWFMLVRPVRHALDSKDWTPTPCVVELSRVVTSRGSKSTTYRPEILYRYEVDGKIHRSSRIGFMQLSSSGRGSKEEFVREHPVGSRTTCYVDPRDPENAVLERGFSASMLFGLLPLVFFGIGLLIIGAMMRKARAPKTTALRSAVNLETSRTSSRMEDSVASGDSVVLKPAMSPVGKAVVALLVGLFWNGIVGVFLFHFFSDWRRGRADWFLGVFLIPFVLVGLGLLCWFLYQILALANPRPRLVLTPGRLFPGGMVRLQYGFSGAVQRIDRLTAELVGREAATYRRGTRSYTDRSVFARIPLLETTDRAAMRSGEAETAIPLDVPPAFKGLNNRMEWFLRVRGEIARWPDVNDEFPVDLTARAIAAQPFVATSDQPELLEGDGLRLGLKGGQTAFLPGETMEGVAAWSLPARPQSAELRLFWFTEGKGTSDLEIVRTEVFDLYEAQAVKPFRFKLPTGPFSVDGRLVSVRWALELVVDASKERVLRRDFVLSPTGQALRLEEVPDEARAKKGFRLARG